MLGCAMTCTLNGRKIGVTGYEFVGRAPGLIHHA